MLKKTLAALAIGSALLSAGQAMAADYVIDKEGQHAFVDFKISHLGYSFITGTFKDLDGKFSFDAAKPEDAKIEVNVRTASVFTNHAERDKHVNSKDFLESGKFLMRSLFPPASSQPARMLMASRPLMWLAT